MCAIQLLLVFKSVDQLIYVIFCFVFCYLLLRLSTIYTRSACVICMSVGYIPWEIAWGLIVFNKSIEEYIP